MDGCDFLVLTLACFPLFLIIVYPLFDVAYLPFDHGYGLQLQLLGITHSKRITVLSITQIHTHACNIPIWWYMGI